MNNFKLFLLLLIGISIVVSFEINEETRKHLDDACKAANEYIQRNERPNEPQITYPQTQIPSSSPVSPAAYFVLPYMLFDPMNQFPFLFKSEETKLLCPLCKRAGLHHDLVDSDQWKNGKTARLQPRIIHDVASPILLVSKLYTCGNGHREIAACDPDLVNQLPDAFVNFVTSHKSGLTKSLIQVCEQLMDKGLSLRSIEDLNKQRYKMFYKGKIQRLVEDRKIARALGSLNAGETVPHFPELKWSFAGTKLISSAIISNFQREEDTYRKLFSDLSAEWISCDHTYKSVSNIGYHRQSDGKWITLYKGFFIVGNEKGQPVQWRFTKTEAYEEVSDAFLQLAERFKRQEKQLRGIYTDTCCKWATKFEQVFPGVPVKLDLFHAVQRFTKSIPKRKQHYAQIARDYSLVFRDPNDLGENRTADTPAKNVLVENLSKFERKWKNVAFDDETTVLNEKSLKEIKNIKIHIEKGCLSGIPPGCGTNKNERLNRHLNEFLSTNKISHLLAYTRCFRLFSSLESMRDETSTVFDPHCDDQIEKCQKDSSKLESFGINVCDMAENQEQKKMNLNAINDDMVKNIASNVKLLIRNSLY